MNKGEVRDQVFQALAPLFTGFKARKKDESFVRTLPVGGWQAVGVSLVDYNPEFRVSLVFTTRLDAVQAIVNQFSGSLPKYHPITITSMTQLAYFFPGQLRKQFYITRPEEVAAMAEELAPVARDRIMAFLNRYQTVEALDQAMNAESDPEFDKANEPYRSMSALTLARLAGNPRFEELVTQYQAKFGGVDAGSLAKVTNLVAHLKTLPSRSG